MLNWKPTIGDPSLMGWTTVAFYFFTAASTIFAVVKNRHNRTGIWFWVMLSLLMVLLGINKQLDIQSLFTEIGRYVARKQGWYQQRRSVQLLFVVIFGGISLGLIGVVWWVLHREWKNYLFPFTGLVLLVTFIVIRAASFHHVDRFLRWGPSGIRMNWILELGGIAVVFLAGVRERCTGRREAKTLSRTS